MFIAKKKRKENIIEYLLYMYQIEDTLRAVSLDFNKLDEKVISNYKVDESQKEELRDWYKELIKQMKSEGIEEKGHLSFLQTLGAEVNDLHLWLNEQKELAVYRNDYEKAKPFLLEFQYKLKSDYTTEVDIALNALYYFVLTRMKQKDINKETEEAIKIISQFLRNLAKYFKQYEEGKLRID